MQSEKSLVDQLVGFLAFEGYQVRTEVPSLGQSIDLVATKGKWLTAVEAKINDWRRALIQCRAHELVADYICIAIATKNISIELRTAVDAAGYGLIHLNRAGTFEWVIRPKRNYRVWSAQRAVIGNHMKSIDYAH